jgi:hypothetical protein
MTSGWDKRPRPAARRWRPRGPAGCLLWVVILVLILLVLSILFGGFQTGTKAEPAKPPPGVSLASLSAAATCVFAGAAAQPPASQS